MKIFKFLLSVLILNNLKKNNWENNKIDHLLDTSETTIVLKYPKFSNSFKILPHVVCFLLFCFVLCGFLTETVFLIKTLLLLEVFCLVLTHRWE